MDQQPIVRSNVGFRDLAHSIKTRRMTMMRGRGVAIVSPAFMPAWCFEEPASHWKK